MSAKKRFLCLDAAFKIWKATHEEESPASNSLIPPQKESDGDKWTQQREEKSLFFPQPDFKFQLVMFINSLQR